MGPCCLQLTYADCFDSNKPPRSSQLTLCKYKKRKDRGGDGVREEREGKAATYRDGKSEKGHTL